MAIFRHVEARKSNLTRLRAAPVEKRWRASSMVVLRWSLPCRRAGVGVVECERGGKGHGVSDHRVVIEQKVRRALTIRRERLIIRDTVP